MAYQENDDSGIVEYFKFNDALYYNYSSLTHGITYGEFLNGKMEPDDETEADWHRLGDAPVDPPEPPPKPPPKPPKQKTMIRKWDRGNFENGNLTRYIEN